MKHRIAQNTWGRAVEATVSRITAHPTDAAMARIKRWAQLVSQFRAWWKENHAHTPAPEGWRRAQGQWRLWDANLNYRPVSQ